MAAAFQLHVPAELTSQQKEYLQTINRSGEHLLALINDILEMSKIEAGRTRLNPVDFNLPALLNDIELMFRARAEAKGLSLTFCFQNEVPRTCMPIAARFDR